MVKAKELKLLRKKLSRVDRLEDPLELLDNDDDNSWWRRGAVQQREETNGSDDKVYSLDYIPSPELSDELLEQFVSLFERNMGDLYRGSSWGLDLQEKADELRHSRARHLIVRDDSQLAAFLHYRFCYDDDDEPSQVVLYVYELQVEPELQRQGLGRKLMKLVESIAKACGVDTVMLTVFKRNKAAMKFYQGLLYEIDKTSPSKFGEMEDYEILSKKLLEN